MKMLTGALAAAALVMVWLPSAEATMLFEATLTGSNVVPPNASAGTGFETVRLNDTQDQITVDLTFSNLTSPATAAHIHGPAPAGVNGLVVFTLTGVPATTSGTLLSPETFAIAPGQVVELESGLLYADMHTATFPGGEIRGQLELVPEPATVSLVGLGLSGLFALRRRHP